MPLDGAECGKMPPQRRSLPRGPRWRLSPPCSGRGSRVAGTGIPFERQHTDARCGPSVVIRYRPQRLERRRVEPQRHIPRTRSFMSAFADDQHGRAEHPLVIRKPPVDWEILGKLVSTVEHSQHRAFAQHHPIIHKILPFPAEDLLPGKVRSPKFVAPRGRYRPSPARLDLIDNEALDFVPCPRRSAARFVPPLLVRGKRQ